MEHEISTAFAEQVRMSARATTARKLKIHLGKTAIRLKRKKCHHQPRILNGFCILEQARMFWNRVVNFCDKHRAASALTLWGLNI